MLSVMSRTIYAIIAQLLLAASGMCAITATSVSCDTAVTCEYMYKQDTKSGGVLKCRPRADKTADSCRSDYCCVPMPTYVPCSSNWSNVDCPNGYRGGNDSTKCRVRANMSDSCSSEFCCAGGNLKVAAISGGDSTSCDDAVNCAWGYNPDPEVAGILSCIRGSTCTEKYCCAPAPAFVPCNEAVKKCKSYKKDPKGGIIRCKPKSSGSQGCTSSTCCQS
eukprot:comp19355_c1_seq1/m.22296 comp19355_c1_seq1/g.22296  ORF comp19355_c1_seq1/g.22296 comp19355_c1_seq1/m.22296 type:complete len:220 (-) comp19355_c1_seq1:135-794(-)